MSELPLVSIGVRTYCRPGLLQRTLQSLNQQRTRFPFEVLVVDNDRARSAEAVIHQNLDAFSSRGHRLSYDVEERQNMFLAQNKIVASARGDLLALIDDDEIAAEDWLECLGSRILETGADAAFGPVLPIVPPNFPAWMTAETVFAIPFRGNSTATFLRRHFGYESNCCFTREALRLRPGPFDPTYGLTGGGDTEFFFFLQKRGAKIVWCEDAIVSEYVGADRSSWKWHWVRSYRVGWSYTKMMHDHEPGLKGRVEPILRAVLGTGLALLRYVRHAHRGRVAAFMLMRDVSRQLGRVGYWLGVKVTPYAGRPPLT